MSNLLCSAGSIGELSYLIIKTESPVGAEVLIKNGEKQIRARYDDVTVAKEWTENQVVRLINSKYEVE